MRFFVAALALFAVAAAGVAVRADDAVDEADVIVGTKDNFDELIAQNEFALVEFYAPWCGHCKRLVPEYAKAATALKGEAALIKVDATVESDLGSKYGVRGYPTLVFFRSGSNVAYNGPRDADGIVAWVKKKSGPPSVALDDGADGAAWAADKLPALVGTFAGARDSAAFKAFVETAKDGDLDDFAFGDVANAAADAITLYTAHAEPAVYAGDADGLKAWVLSEGYPLVDELPAAWERYSKRAHPLAIVFVDPDEANKDANKALLDTVTKAAGETKDSFSFSWADGVRFKQQIERMGAPTDKLPVVAAMKLNGKANFPYDGELTADALAAWGKGIASGELKPHLKSEAVPESQDGPVTVIVGKSFKDVALDADKDVLLEIYAPWCGHCKSLAPTWEKLAAAYQANPTVVIAKMDGTANDIEEIEYRGFPTIKFFPAGSDSAADAVDYDGGRDLDAFKSFLEANAKGSGGGKAAEEEAAAAASDDAGEEKKTEL